MNSYIFTSNYMTRYVFFLVWPLYECGGGGGGVGGGVCVCVGGVDFPATHPCHKNA